MTAPAGAAGAGAGPRSATPPVWPLLLAGMGDTAGAFVSLERAVEIHDPFLVYHFVSDPLLEGLRREPRGEALLRRMGLR